MSTRPRYSQPEVKYRLTDLTDPHVVLPSSYSTLNEAWARAAQRWLRDGGAPKAAMTMLEMEDTGNVEVWQVARHCDTTRHTTGQHTLAETWSRSLTLRTRGAFDAAYVHLAASMVDSLLDEPTWGLDTVVVSEAGEMFMGIVTAIDDQTIVFADGLRVALFDTTEIAVTQGGL